MIMKKTAKWLVCLLMAVCVSVTLCFTACSNTEEPPAHTQHVDANNDGKCDECGATMNSQGENPGTDPEPEGPLYKTPTQDADYWGTMSETKGDLMKEDVSEKEIAYQFSTIYNHVSNTADPRAYYLLINLYEDGYIRAYQYYDDGILFEYGGYWLNEEELGNGIWMGVLEYGMDMGGTVNVYTYDWSNNILLENGTFTFSFSISLGNADGGLYVRQAEFSEMDGKVAYATVQDWFGYLTDETGDTVTGTDFSGWAPNAAEIIADIALYYNGNTSSSTKQSAKFEAGGKYNIADGQIEGTWAVENGVLTLTGALSYDAATRTMKLAGEGYSFSAVLTQAQMSALGITA